MQHVIIHIVGRNEGDRAATVARLEALSPDAWVIRAAESAQGLGQALIVAKALLTGSNSQVSIVGGIRPTEITPGQSIGLTNTLKSLPFPAFVYADAEPRLGDYPASAVVAAPSISWGGGPATRPRHAGPARSEGASL
jgi:hypothetical protein